MASHRAQTQTHPLIRVRLCDGRKQCSSRHDCFTCSKDLRRLGLGFGFTSLNIHVSEATPTEVREKEEKHTIFESMTTGIKEAQKNAVWRMMTAAENSIAERLHTG